LKAKEAASGFVPVAENFHSQTLVPEFTVKTFTFAVLPWFARLDE
jgi:hypothetical protein